MPTGTGTRPRPAVTGPPSGEYVDPATGEILPAGPAGAAEAAVLLKSNDPQVRALLDSGRLIEVDADTAERAAQAIVARILADTADAAAILTPKAPVGLRERVGHEITVHSVAWMPSSFQGGASVYAVIEALDHAVDGAPALFTTGARNIMAQLLALDLGGHLPRRVRVHQVEKATKAGFRPMWLLDAKAGK